MKRAIVTGASRGLGLALTRALAERGWRVTVDARDGEALERAVAGLDGVVAVAGDIADPEHRRRLVEAAGRTDRPAGQQRQRARQPRRCRRWPSTRSTISGRHTRSTSSRRWRSCNSRFPGSPAGARIVNLTSDAAVEAYETWGGYGSSKAALAQLTAVLGVEHPGLRFYAVDPGDMRTQMQQDAFPGEDISDRPPPEESVPGLLALIEGDEPSGLYRARDVVGASA